MNLLLKISSTISYKKIGIIVAIRKKTDFDISYYQMLKKGNSVDICYAMEGLKSFDDIDFQAEKYPTIMCIQGIGLVQRLMTGNYTDLKQNIPNINTEDYLIEFDKANPENRLIALYRKDQIDCILNEKVLGRIPVHNISLGLVNTSRYLKLFPKETKSFEADGNVLVISENEIQEIQKNTTSDDSYYLFAGKTRKASEILALSAGLNYFTNKGWNTHQIKNIEKRIKEYTALKLSTFILYYLGATMFALLLINFLVFNYYNASRETLELESLGVSTIQNEINQLQSDFNTKKQFAQQNNVSGSFAFAFYADRIASLADEGVKFLELSVCPVAGKVKEGKVISFESSLLRVRGNAPSSETYSDFLEKIKESSWVKKLNKQVYTFNNETKSADFEIEIELDHAIE